MLGNYLSQVTNDNTGQLGEQSIETDSDSKINGLGKALKNRRTLHGNVSPSTTPIYMRYITPSTSEKTPRAKTIRHKKIYGNNQSHTNWIPSIFQTFLTILYR